MTPHPDVKKSFITPLSKVGKNKKYIVLLIILLIGGWAVWTRFISPSNNQTTATIQASQVEKGTLVVSVTAAGQVSSNNNLSANTNASGVIKSVFVKNGQPVKSGEKLVELELDQESQQKYTQALASYQSAKNNLASAQAKINSLQAAAFKANQTFMNGKGSDDNPDTSDPNYIQENANWLHAEAEYKNQASVIAQAQTALNSAAQSLRLASPVVYAPISGTVSGLSMMEGSVIARANTTETSTGQTVASIVTIAQPTVTVNLTEVDITKVRLGNKATITIDALADKTYTGKVMSIDTVGSVSSGVTSYSAVIVFDTDASEVFTNMSAQASIITETKSGVILVPTSAVQTLDNQSTVRVMKNNEQETIVVETGLSSGTQIEIVSGLNEGDTIVSSAATLAPRQSGGQTTSPFSGMSGPGGLGGGGAQIRIAR